MAIGLHERSDRVARPLGAVVATGDGYDVLRHPAHPGYWFGNCLLLHDAPEPSALSRWRRVWDRELGSTPGLERVVLLAETPAADVPEGLAESARAEGLELEVEDVLVLDTLRAHPPTPGVQIRPVTGEEWAAVVDLSIRHSEAGQEDFRRWRMGEYARLIEAGRGAWWAAWHDGLPVASAGLFHGDGLSRYQQVLTHAAHRRQGIAAALVAGMVAAHLAETPDDPLVIVADRDSSPARLYRRVGFTPAATALTLIGPVP